MSELESGESVKSKPIYVPINSLDERLQVSDSLPYAIERSGQAIMGYSQQASSASVNNVQFTLNVPNLSTLIDRHIYIRTTLQWTLSGANANAGVPFLSNVDGAGAVGTWGNGFGFGPFPFHQMVSSLTVTINQQPITINMNECLPLLQRMFERDVLEESCNETPCMLDYFQSYDSGFSAITTPRQSNVLGDASYATAITSGVKPRGSYYVTVANVGGNGGTSATVTATIVEPLLLSPFLIGYMNQNQQGMYGIQNISFNFTLQPNNCRSLRVRPAFTNVTACALTSITQASTYLDVTYITPPSGSKLYLPSRNEVPYMQVESQRTQAPAIANGATAIISSNDYQLSKMPDKVLICARKKLSNQICTDSDCYLPISGVSVVFGGNSGILASTTQHQLWQASVRNGSNQSWDEFSGVTSIGGASIATCGSVLALAFGKDIAIADPFTVSGSLGSYNFQVQVTVTNNTGANIVGNGDYELFMVFLYGGIFVNELSTSSIVVGFVDKMSVERVSNEDYVDTHSSKRMYGGSFFGSLGKVLKHVKPIARALAPVARTAMEGSSNDKVRKAASVMKALGAGMSAGSYTAGSKFAGRLHM